MNLADIIDRHAAFWPGKAAIRFGGGTLSYAALADRIGRAARGLSVEFGVGRGDRVAVLAHNHPDTLVLLYACARLGAILAPLNWRLAAAEQLYILGDCAPKLLVVEQPFADIAGPLAATQPATRVVALEEILSGPDLDEPPAAAGESGPAGGSFDQPLLVIYTSGTTGRPKGAVLSQSAILFNGVMAQDMHALTANDHVLSVLPFFHVGGLNIQTIPALHAGATVTIHPRFAADATLAAIEEDRPTLTVLVPSTIAALIEHPGFTKTDLSSLRAVATGSTVVPQPLIDALEARGLDVLQVYGSTETGPISIYTRLGAGHATRIGSTGLPGLLCEARVVDDAGRDVPPGTDGEIAIRGPNVFSGYWGDEAATREAMRDGWYLTGDIGARDADGYFYVHDRKKNMIVSGGENVYPAEIERVLGHHPAVSACAVIGRPDPRWQEAPVAYVVLKPGAVCDAEDLRRHVLSELARFKAPREFHFVDDLPRSALGKVQHFRLRDSARPDDQP